jgi:hypothetical protein
VTARAIEAVELRDLRVQCGHALGDLRARFAERMHRPLASGEQNPRSLHLASSAGLAIGGCLALRPARGVDLHDA